MHKEDPQTAVHSSAGAEAAAMAVGACYERDLAPDPTPKDAQIRIRSGGPTRHVCEVSCLGVGSGPRSRNGGNRHCESVTELLGGGLHSGWAGPPVSSVGDHNPRDLSVFVGIRGRGARPGAPENPLMPIDPKPRPRLADSPPESLSSRSPASVGQATGSGGPTRSRSVCP